MRKILLLAVLLLPLGLCAKQTDADEAYQKNNFTDALTAYQQQVKTASGEDLYKAQLRVIASQYMLGQYMNAAKTAFTTSLPGDPVWKARFLLYRIQTAEQVRGMYRQILSNADEESGEFEQLSADQWQDKINESFEQLWDLRPYLIYAPIEQETLILDVKNTDTKAIPTLFDFVVLQWKQRLQAVAPIQPLRAADILTLNYKVTQTKKPDVQKLVSILAEATKLTGTAREDARLIWETDRIALPFDNSAYFAFEDKPKQRAEAIRLLQTLAGYSEVKQSLWNKITHALRFSNADYGKSYAALKAAQMLNADQEYAQAVALCDWADKNLSSNYYNQSCKQLAAQIRQPVLQVESTSYTQDPSHTTLSVSMRNATNLYARLYRVTQEELLAWSGDKKPWSWDYLTAIPNDSIPQLLKKTPLNKFIKPIAYEKPHAYAKQDLSLPPLQHGFYAVAFSYDKSFDTAKAPVSALVLNATDLALFVTTAIEDDPAKYHTTKDQTFHPNVFRIYTVNLKTGQPEANSSITYFTDWQGNKSTGTTNSDGMLKLAREIRLASSDSYNILPKATKRDSTALINNHIHFYFNSSAPVRFYLETDRAIYRPGQTVQLAVYGFEAAGRGFKTLPADTQVKLMVRDANYEKVLEQTLSLNAYGTAKTQLTLPETGLLGAYHAEISYQLNRRTYRGYSNFSVEEYKRPEYEVTLDPAGTLQYGKQTTVSGKALYYFGAPVENATVQYTINRSTYHPPFWWWRPFVTENDLVASGQTKTRADGSFEIPFTPQPGTNKATPYSFKVQVSVRDESGRSIDAQQSYKASEKEAFFSVSFDQGFYDANVTGILAHIKLLDINSQPIAGKFSAEIVELQNTFKTQKTTSDRYNDDTLEKWYAENDVVRSVSKQTFSVTTGQESVLDLPALSEGIYQLKLSAKNAENTDLIFLVAAPQSKLALPAVAIAQQKKYYPGNQAKILIGAGELTGPKQVEIYQDGQFLALSQRVGKGVSIYTLPIKEEWRGGIGLRWFGASNWHTYDASTQLEVPYDNKQLNLTIQVPEDVKPGQKVNWMLTAKNAATNAVSGQAAVRVYDKSLDYYAKVQPAFGLDNLYPQSSLNASFTDSSFNTYGRSYTTLKQQTDHSFSYPQMPQINLAARFARYGMVLTKGMALRSAAPMMASAKATFNAAQMDDMAVEEAAGTYGVQETATADRGESQEMGEETPSTDSPRTDFSETAYYNPMLPITAGKANVSFTMPQSLTGWNVQALAFTKDANVGSFTAQTVTRKDIMVRLSLPRFWREGDTSTLVAQITNVTNKKAIAQITLDVLKDDKNAAQAFGLDKLTQTVTIPAKGNVAVTWPVTIPEGVGVATVTATVRTGQDSDSESRQLPLLPSKERITDSTTAALETGSQTLRLENLLSADNTRRVSTVTLRVDPGLLLTVLNSMPQLLRPGYNDALSLVNRYVPLAVLNAFYKNYPRLQEAVGKIPQRNTQIPAWDNTDPARLILLEETPWLQTSRGGATRKDFLTDIFNPSAVNTTREKIEKQLSKYQTASGGFTWMPGGEPTEFITLRVLASYAQILRYGGEIPQASAQKALSWLAPRIEKNLKESTPSASAVSYALYGAYVFTAYPKTWKAVQSAPVKKWLDYADQHAAYMTPLGQTYAAAAYYRLGENTKAQNYLDLVLSRMKTDPTTGAHFAPEAQSWLWYNDTLATQTATLRTLLEIRPESDKAIELVKWLLFNRKAQQWRDSTTAAQAVYTLLEYMQRKGLLDQPAQYELQWGDQHTALNFQPMDWSEQLAWTKEAQNVDPQYYTAQVTKRGGLTGFVTLDAVYTTAHAKASQPGVLNVSRRYLLKSTEDGRQKVRALNSDEKIPVGAEVEVELTLTASSAFDFVLLTDPKPAGFENTDLTSGWTWNALSFYREVRDAGTNFFLNRVPAGTYTLRYTLRPTLEGQYQVLPAQVQSMYAPEFSAHTASNQLNVKK